MFKQGFPTPTPAWANCYRLVYTLVDPTPFGALILSCNSCKNGNISFFVVSTIVYFIQSKKYEYSFHTILFFCLP